MVERFLKVVDSVRKALKHLSSLTLLKDNNVPILSNNFNALTPIKLAAEALSRRDANLIKGRCDFEVLLESLHENNDNFSKELLNALSFCIGERRNQDLVSLIKLLQTLDLKTTENEQVLDLHIRDRDRLTDAINAAFKSKK